MPEGLDSILGRREIAHWLRRWQWHLISVCLSVGIVGAIVVGISTRDEFVRDFTANLAADAVVAALAFGLATVAFGLAERRQRRIEAQRKAYHVLAKEVYENAEVIASSVESLREGLIPRPDRSLSTEAWKLLIQSPLVAHLPVELVWGLQSSYSMSEEALTALGRRVRQTRPKLHGMVATQMLCEFELVWEEWRNVIKMLQRYIAE